MNTAFVIGNGKSRAGIDLPALQKHGKVYGCNALYRDFAPDVLIATDKGISEEIQHGGYAKNHIFYTRTPLPNLGAKKIEYNWGWSSGPIALTYASNSSAKIIYILGFDFSGTNGKFNNVYANSQHYKKSNDVETYYGNWINQCYETIKRNDKKRYIRVIETDTLLPKQFNALKNLTHLNKQEFMLRFVTAL